MFLFDAKGLIHTAHAGARYRTVDGALVATPWQGRFWAHEVWGGMRIPLHGEVAWLLPEGPSPYWHGRITDIVYLELCAFSHNKAETATIGGRFVCSRKQNGVFSHCYRRIIF